MATETRRDGEGMDARLWGELQRHIDLAMVYAKLPIGDFFRLRVVCKEWSRLATDRPFLEDVFREPIPKPYFVIGTWKMRHRLLTYDTASRRWSSTRTPYALCEAGGVLREDFNSNRIFNLHTRVFCSPPRPPLHDDDYNEDVAGEPVVGITVDTSVKPYRFKMILGNEFLETQVYHSETNSWTYGDSNLVVAFCPDRYRASCAQFHGLLYIRGARVDLHIYDSENEEWHYNSPGIPDDAWLFGDVGAWRDRLFFFGVKERCAVTVLELAQEAWTRVDSMPEALCSWMLAGQEADMEVESVFCGEHVLVYCCGGLEEVTERAVLYHLDQKTWTVVELPGLRCLLWSDAGNDLTLRVVNRVLKRKAEREATTSEEGGRGR
jgi:hypothetical protein